MTMLMLTPLRLQFPGKVFQVYSRAGPQVFIPPNLMEEFKALPDSVLSISEGVREVGLVHVKKDSNLMDHSSSRLNIPCSLILDTRSGLCG
jgi:hypothetical protein